MRVKVDFPLDVIKKGIAEKDISAVLNKRLEVRKGDWIVEGFAGTVDLDLQGDILSKEAWKKAESDLVGATLLFNHDQDNPLGQIIQTRATDEGLWIQARVSKTEEKRWEQINDDTLNKYSVRGFVIDAHKEFRKDEGRIANIVDEMKLVEASMVTVPGNPQAKKIVSYIQKALNDYEKDGGDIPFKGDKKDLEKAWTTEYINNLPDGAFAIIEPAYAKEETKDKRARHLPHHTKSVSASVTNTGKIKNDSDDSVDLSHYRNALARVNQIKPTTDSISASELRKKAEKHLNKHRDLLNKSSVLHDLLKSLEGGDKRMDLSTLNEKEFLDMEKLLSGLIESENDSEKKKAYEVISEKIKKREKDKKEIEKEYPYPTKKSEESYEDYGKRVEEFSKKEENNDFPCPEKGEEESLEDFGKRAEKGREMISKKAWSWINEEIKKENDPEGSEPENNDEGKYTQEDVDKVVDKVKAEASKSVETKEKKIGDLESTIKDIKADIETEKKWKEISRHYEKEDTDLIKGILKKSILGETLSAKETLQLVNKKKAESNLEVGEQFSKSFNDNEKEKIKKEFGIKTRKSDN